MTVRALLICSPDNVGSIRRLCSAISETIAYRWLCFLSIYDPVFDYSSISHFTDRISRAGFSAIFEGLNDELLRLGILARANFASVHHDFLELPIAIGDLRRDLERFRIRSEEVGAAFGGN